MNAEIPASYPAPQRPQPHRPQPHRPLPVSSGVMRVLEGFMNDLEEGKSPDPEAIIAAHPELAEPLRTFLASLEFLQGAARKLASPQSEAARAPPAQAESAGAAQLGDFRLLREIGRGGMGVVYEAEQISLSRRVALKVLPFAGVLDPRQLQRFKNESRAAAGLHHPHIVPVYAVGAERGVHFYAMQYIEGRTLEQIVRELADAENTEGQKTEARSQRSEVGGRRSDKEPMREGGGAADSDAVTELSLRAAPPAITSGPALSTARQAANSTSLSPQSKDRHRAVARLGAQIAEALDHAHGLGITHRDIKPSNLIVDAQGDVWVTDFGLAQMEADVSITHTGELVGTLRYMSPEQAAGERGVLDHRTDIYSLGITLYELLALRPAFAGAGRPEILGKVLSEDPAPLSKLARGIPKDLETIVLKAIAKEPADRFKSAGEMAAELRRFVNDEPIRSRRTSLAQRASRWTRRHTGVVWMSLLIMFLATGASIAAAVALEAERAATVLAKRQADRNAAELRKEKERLQASAIGQYELRIRNAEDRYVSEMHQASEALVESDPHTMASIIDRSRPGVRRSEPDLRGFEWRLLDNFSRPDLERVRVSDEPLYCLAYSGDGKLLVVAGKDAILRAFDAATLRPLFQLPTGQIEINQVAFSPDDRTLATAGDDGKVKLWNRETREPIRSIPAHAGKAFQAIFHADGESLFSSGDEPTVRRWRVATGELMQEYAADATISDIALSRDGNWLAAVEDDTRAWIWSLPDAKRHSPIPLEKNGSTVAFSPDGRWWATGDKGGNVQVLIVGQSQVLQRLRHRDGICALAFSSEGERLAVSDKEGVVGIHAVAPLEPTPQLFRFLSRWQAHAGRAYDLSWSPTEDALVSLGADGAVKVWRSPANRVIRRLIRENESPVALAATAIEGQFAAIMTPAGHPRHVVVYDAHSAAVKVSVYPGEFPQQVASAWNGAFAVTMHRGLGIKLVARSGEVHSIQPPPNGLDRVFFPRNSQSFFALPYEGRAPISTIDIDTGKLYGSWGDVPGGEAAALADDGSWLAVANDNDIEIWDVARRAHHVTLRGHASTISDLEFIPGGRTLASVSADRTLRIWDSVEGAQLSSLVGHASRPTSVAWSRDGGTIASADDGGAIRMWSSKLRREVCVLPCANSPIHDLTFSAEGRYLAWRDEETIWLAQAGEYADGQQQTVAKINALRPRGRDHSLGVVVDVAETMLCVFDGVSDRAIGSVPLPLQGLAIDVVLSPDASRAYVSMGPAKKVVVVDLYAFEVVGELIDVPTEAYGLAMTADGRYVLVVGEGERQPLSVIDTRTLKVKSYNVGAANAVAVNSAGDVILVDTSEGLLRRARISSEGVLSLSKETLSLPGASGVALARGGKSGIAIGTNTLCSFLVAGMRKVKLAQVDQVNSVVFSPVQDRFYIRDHVYVRAYPFDGESGDWRPDKASWGTSEFPFAVTHNGVNRLAVSPDGTQVLVARDGGLSILNAANGNYLRGKSNVAGFLLGIDIRRPQQSNTGDASASR